MAPPVSFGADHRDDPESRPAGRGRPAGLHPVSWLDDGTGAQVLTDLAPAAGRRKDAVMLSARLGGCRSRCITPGCS
jgi:hypothetical protein